jgi:hypothetical protein
MPTPHEKLRIAQARAADVSWVNNLLLWIEGLHGTHEAQMKLELSSWVEEYSPQIVNRTDVHVTNLSSPHATLH